MTITSAADSAVRVATTSAARTRLAAAALDLFERDGFEATTVDAIAAAVGMNRRTFFRYFAAKEDAVFADQSELVQQVRAGLEQGTGEPVAVAGHVLEQLLEKLAANAATYRRVDALVQTSPALADRELVWWGEYQRMLGAYLGETASGQRNQMFANIIAAALLAALRQVLTSFLRSEATEDPRAMFVELADEIIESMSGGGPRGAGPAPGHPDHNGALDASGYPGSPARPAR